MAQGEEPEFRLQHHKKKKKYTYTVVYMYEDLYSTGGWRF
jgi:hypothetical protein